MNSATLPELLTITEVADVLRVHPNTVRRYIATEELPATKIVGVWRVHRDDMLKLLTTHENGGVA